MQNLHTTTPRLHVNLLLQQMVCVMYYARNSFTDHRAGVGMPAEVPSDASKEAVQHPRSRMEVIIELPPMKKKRKSQGRDGERPKKKANVSPAKGSLASCSP